jgi:xanthine dehydrogenase small subunit
MNAIRFTLNGEPRAETGVGLSTTVLDWLRAQGLTGTKEGCAEGDCGACTILLDRGPGHAPRFQAVNSCLMLVPQLAGTNVKTVEGISGRNGGLHPAQQLLIEADGTQCGFCTPGFVMAMAAFAASGEPRDDVHIHEALAGNLCRCTGYRAIVDACRKLPLPEFEEETVITVSAHVRRTYENGGQRFVAPSELEDLLELRAGHPDALILGGGTDLGIRASKDRERFPLVIHTRDVIGLDELGLREGALEIGAAATYTDALPLIDRHFPSFGAMIRRIGSRQIRNLGTIAGNLVNASPIGDTPPCLIALGAEVTIASVRGARSMPVEFFITGYRKTALAPDEVVTAIRIPLLKKSERFETYKLSKRFDQDISAVIGAFCSRPGATPVTRIAFGGMADRPRRSESAERLLDSCGTEPVGGAAAIEAALAKDFTPLSDHRASAGYRLQAAAGLVRRFLFEGGGPASRLEAL